MKLKRILFWIVVLPISLFLLLQLYFLIQIIWWRSFNPDSTSFMRKQEAILQEKDPKFTLKHKWVDYSKISRNLKRAVIASEDDGFSDHEGVDWDAMQKAFEKNQKKGKVVSGGSTITQQLAKNLFLSGERSYYRKGQELIITFMLEMCMDKERIFEIYLNSVEWGIGVFGAEAAARHYYGISAAALSPMQAARLAVMLPKPRYYDKNTGSAYLQRRSEVILRRMNSSELPAR
ncbi:monofunctional biosynthetic peptidoglycan transglycosylase [Undibacterium seohonense]|jgi:monofunctional biosynthetic peptidoglycan transglycosylase|uniref:Biosynthetic peptidoglycan transglycosylase n=1 Tax=Undibacterium seohonense TaxID=1344950 RepID=A0ABR6X8Z6_9BURK|nr:monofunctional biosynthetic peptidoglycan transglycosylase [Undibacterium seohonense]MBC3809123.1 monofunctional biosynthetic peptidoglycan transglycosylase [Undibacterium seohonense]